MKTQPKRVMSIFSLVMINVVAVDSLRSLPFGAKYGFSIVFYYLLAALLFFIPTALVAAELATGWPKRGGVYVWVREAFGVRWGFFTIWLQWIYNICWYPTIMSLLAATIAYMINPSLVHSKGYMLSVVFILFFSTTIINLFGMKVFSRIANFSALIGSIIPMMLIMFLGIWWVSDGQTIQIQMNWNTFVPHVANLGVLVLMTNVLYSLVGMEMSAIHAQEVKNPQRSYPKALLWSAIIILITLIGGSLAIAMVIPNQKIELLTGMLELYYTFFQAHHIAWMTVVIGICIIIGGLGCVCAWVLGPSKGLMVAAADGALPSWMAKTNRFQAPVVVLGIQAVIFTLICGVFLLMPTVNSSYWILSDITAILSLLSYVMMFISAIVLRYKAPNTPRAYRIPGGNWGLWIVCIIGLLSCLATIFIGFVPPSEINVGSISQYEWILGGGVAVFCIAPFVVYRLTQRG